MDLKVFNEFRSLIYEQSGITLNPGKESLVAARVGRRLADLGLTDYRDYLTHLKTDVHGEEIVNLLDAISTNVTYFFREPDHFQFLEDELTRMKKTGQSKYRIWCAASSSGEEPYSISMTCRSILDMNSVDLKILATDISTKVLEKAKRGSYSKALLKDIPLKFRNPDYLTVSDNIEMSENVKRNLTFARLNLSMPPFPMNGPFDIVFCRNVMIYFDNAVRAKLIKDVWRLLRPGGYFIVGHSETLTGISTKFQVVSPSVYRKELE